MAVKYKAKRSFSYGFPGKDQEFQKNKFYDKVPEDVAFEFEEVEAAAPKKSKKVEDK